MCGIVGSLGFKQFSIDGALATMRRRGPDSVGIHRDLERELVLGHSRLAIIDTSDSGLQPMISHCGRYILVYNGELYNYRELRLGLEQTGVVFKGHSDSEVLLAMYVRDGTDCFKKLNGIFAAAFWDQETGLLCLVRDPLGVKPLYIAEGAGSIAFASEIKALVRGSAVKPALNPAAVLAHLSYLWSPGTETILRGVRKLLPGHALEFRQGRIVKEWRYRDLAYQLNPALSDSEVAAKHVAAGVQEAVRRQMVADVPLGAFLSGGLDSSAVVAFAQRELTGSAKLQCFSIDITDGKTSAEGFAEDLPYARKAAQHLGVELHVVGVGAEMMDRLPEMLYFLDEPTPDPAALNALYISELARSNGIKVLLSGAGGDDIFTGYRRHFALNQEGWWRSWPAPLREMLGGVAGGVPTGNALGRRFNKAFRHAGLDEDRRLASYFQWLDTDRALSLLSPELKADLTGETLFAPLLSSLSQLPAGVDPLNRMLYLECKHFLADHNLNYTDKMGMAASVEVRVPLLDLDLVDLANALPVSLKQRGTTGKWIFKKAMEPYLPHDVIYRPKTGFGAPLRKWLTGPMKDVVGEILTPANLLRRGIFEPSAVQKLVQDNAAGKIDANYTIFGIVCLELWCRQYLDGHWVI